MYKVEEIDIITDMASDLCEYGWEYIIKNNTQPTHEMDNYIVEMYNNQHYELGTLSLDLYMNPQCENLEWRDDITIQVKNPEWLFAELAQQYKQAYYNVKTKLERTEKLIDLRTPDNRESDEFWDSIFTEDYPLTKENVYKELKDYYYILKQLPSVYCEVTGGRLSKLNYPAESVIQAHNDYIRTIEEDYQNEIQVLQEEINRLKNGTSI